MDLDMGRINGKKFLAEPASNESVLDLNPELDPYLYVCAQNLSLF